MRVHRGIVRSDREAVDSRQILLRVIPKVSDCLDHLLGIFEFFGGIARNRLQVAVNRVGIIDFSLVPFCILIMQRCLHRASHLDRVHKAGVSIQVKAAERDRVLRIVIISRFSRAFAGLRDSERHIGIVHRTAHILQIRVDVQADFARQEQVAAADNPSRFNGDRDIMLRHHEGEAARLGFIGIIGSERQWNGYGLSVVGIRCNRNVDQLAAAVCARIDDHRLALGHLLGLTRIDRNRRGNADDAELGAYNSYIMKDGDLLELRDQAHRCAFCGEGSAHCAFGRTGPKLILTLMRPVLVFVREADPDHSPTFVRRYRVTDLLPEVEVVKNVRRRCVAVRKVVVVICGTGAERDLTVLQIVPIGRICALRILLRDTVLGLCQSAVRIIGARGAFRTDGCPALLDREAKAASPLPVVIMRNAIIVRIRYTAVIRQRFHEEHELIAIIRYIML